MKAGTACGLVWLTLLFWVQNTDGLMGDQYHCYLCRAMVDPKTRKWIKDPAGPAIDNVDDCMNGPKPYQSELVSFGSGGSFHCIVKLSIESEHSLVNAGRFLRHKLDEGAWPDNDPRWGSCHVVLRKEEEDSMDQVMCTCHWDNCNTQLYQQMLAMRRHFRGVGSRIQDSLALMTTLLVVLVFKILRKLL